MCCDFLNFDFWHGNPAKDLIHHSDRGWKINGKNMFLLYSPLFQPFKTIGHLSACSNPHLWPATQYVC